MDSDLVSIILPVFNAEMYLNDCLNSILNQTYKSWELVIVDDGSTDLSSEIIKSYTDPRIRYTHQENAGVASALNLGLSIAKGHYVCRMDSDDLMCPNRLEKQISFLQFNPDVGVLGGQAEAFDEKGRRYVIKKPLKDKALKWLMLYENPFVHPTVMFNLKNTGDIHYPKVRMEDWELWVQLFSQTKFANLPDVVLSYRLHENQANLKYKADIINNLVVYKSRSLVAEYFNIRKYTYLHFISLWTKSVSSVDEYLRVILFVLRTIYRGNNQIDLLSFKLKKSVGYIKAIRIEKKNN